MNTQISKKLNSIHI